MAVDISTKFSVDLSAVVSNSVDAVKLVRKREQARKEAEFQRAVANGMSYNEQVTFREDQIKEEEKSSLKDSEYVASLEKSVADTKKLNRFNRYRTRYAEALAELSSGKINEEQYLSTLKNSLIGIDDPELRLEIQGDIVTGEQKVKTYRDTILSNQVKKARFDGTQSALSDAVQRVNNARALATINGNEDEVAAYDETLSALNSQLATVRIQDSITDFQVRSATRGVNPVEKLNYLNNEIGRADPSSPIRVGERTYRSAQEFWTLERDGFLAGSSQLFGKFFDELDAHTKNAISANAVKFGYPTQVVLDEAFNTFNELRSKPEILPFVNRLDITQASVMSEAVDKLAKTVNAVGTNNLTFKEADAQLQNIGKKYGVDVTSYRLQLDEQLRNLARGGVIDEVEAAALAPDVKVSLPGVEPAKPTTPGAAPEAPKVPTTPTAPTAGTRVVREGETLSAIAQEVGVSLQQILDLNPQFKENPDLIKPGQTVTLPGAPTPETKPTPTPEVPPTSTPAPTPAVTPTPTTPTTTPPVAPTVTPLQPQPQNRKVVTVEKGETLSAIALRELGDASRWRELKTESGEGYDEETAKKLQIGTKLVVPI